MNEQITDVEKTTEHYIFRHNWAYVILYVAIAAVYAYGIVRYMWPFQAIIVYFLLGAGLVAHVQSRVRKQFIQQLAAELGFLYSPTAPTEGLQGKLFSVGHSQSITDVLSGIHDGLPLRIFTFNFVTGYGKQSHTNTYTVFEASLNHEVPDILLFSKEYGSEIMGATLGDESITLEGNFNQYFTLRVPKGFEMEAYQILTPDVMADLIDRAKGYSFEFVGTHLYLYNTAALGTRAKFDEMYALVGYLDNLFRRNAASIDMPTRSSPEGPVVA